MIRTSTLVCLISLFVAGSFSIASAFANTISGTISLPSGVTAPSGGVILTVRSLRFDSFGFGRDRVTIPSGSSSTNYSLVFSDDVERQVVFNCDDGCGSLDITTSGGWSNTSGVGGDFSAQVFNAGQNHVVNIQLETADTFTGSVSLPEGLVAKGNEFLLASISSNNRFSFESYSEGEILTAGQTSFDFKIGVPSNATSSSWQVRFVCLDCETRVESKTHYATTIIGAPPALDSDSSFPFLKNTDYANLNLTLIDNKPINMKQVILSPILLLLDDENP